MGVVGLMERAGEIGKPAPPKEDYSDCKWVVIGSRVLGGEQIVLVFEKQFLKESRRENPGMTIYLPKEITELGAYKDDPDFIRRVHAAKREFCGWIIPEDSQVIELLVERR